MKQTARSCIAVRSAAIVLAASVLIVIGTVGAGHICGELEPITVQPSSGNMPDSQVAGAPSPELPVPWDAEKIYDLQSGRDKNARLVTYISDNLPPADICGFYRSELPKYGWTECSATETQLNKHIGDISIMLFFRHPVREVAVLVDPEGEGAAWTIVARTKIIGGDNR